MSSHWKSLCEKQEVFKFKGHDFLVDYAKYLIEYMDTVRPKEYGSTEKRINDAHT